MKTMAISEFKAHSLQVLGRVARTKETVVVTKRGKPLVEVIPFRHSDELSVPGKLSETLVFEKDIESPLGESIWSWRLQVKYLLDTHVWVWWNMSPEHLSRKVKGLIAASKKYEEILLSAISVWEFCKLLEKRRIGISCDPRDWLETALAMPKLRLVPLSPMIAYRSTALPQLASTDPADQIIVATAQEENAILLTKDELIRQSTCLRTIW